MTGCTYYQNATTCAVCSVNYYLKSDGTCATSKTNCITHSSTGTCTECQDGYALNNGSCTSIANCRLSTGSTCTACNTNYFLNAQGTCQNATPITNCLYYSASTLCSQCNSGYYLANDQKSCILITYNVGVVGTNANVSCHVATEDYTCSICKGG